MIIRDTDLEDAFLVKDGKVFVSSTQKEMIKALYDMRSTPTKADISRLLGKPVAKTWWKRFLMHSHNDFNGHRAAVVEKAKHQAELREKRKERKRLRRQKQKAQKKSTPPAPKRIPQRQDFYLSREWRELRYRVLKNHGPICMLCNASRETGSVMHVDHIKPRSKHPELELCYDNLQVLCADCNLGKSNKDETDFRSKLLSKKGIRE